MATNYNSKPKKKARIENVDRLKKILTYSSQQLQQLLKVNKGLEKWIKHIRTNYRQVTFLVT